MFSTLRFTAPTEIISVKLIGVNLLSVSGNYRLSQICEHSVVITAELFAEFYVDLLAFRNSASAIYTCSSTLYFVLPHLKVHSLCLSYLPT